MNFTGGLQAVDNAGAGSTDVSLATTVPNDHTFTGNLSSSGAANFNFSGASGTFDTTTGNVRLNGDTTVAAGKTLTAGAGTTTGNAVSVNTGNALAGGSALSVDTGTSAFSGNAVNITSGGNFTGTLVNLSANATATGTVLGITTNVLTTGAVINANLGASIYTGSAGALRLTANAASSGTLLAISGTTLGANGGKAAEITLGTPGGAAEPAEGKAIRVALGTAGDAYYANAASGFTGSFARYQVAGVDVVKIDGTNITTTDNFGQTGAATFSTGTGNISLNGNVITNITQTGATSVSTGTGPVSLNGDTTVAAAKNLSAAAGTGKFDFSLATGTFDTSTGAVTLRGNTATASGVTFTAGSGIMNAVNAVTVGTGLLTTGSAIKVDVGASAPGGAVNSTQGLGLDISGTGAFAGLGNNASLAKFTSTGAFTGTLAKLSADNTQTGTVLGISAASLTTGKAIDVQLAAAYAGGGANQGAVNVRGGAFSGNLLSVSASSNAQTLASSLANFAAPLTQGHLVNLAVTGTYAGTGALYVDLTGATGIPTGTSILVNTATAYTGKFIDLQIAGVSKFSVDPTNVATANNIVQTGVTTFSTGTGNISLNGTIITNITQTGATTFSTGTGNISLNGTIITNITQTGATTFSTGTGNISLNGTIITNITQTGATTFSTGTGAVSLNGNTAVAAGRSFTVGGGTPITAIELGTCTNANSAQTTCSASNGNTTGITLANLKLTDSITISGRTNGNPFIPCVVKGIVAGTSFRIDCIANPGNGLVWNVLVVRK